MNVTTANKTGRESRSAVKRRKDANRVRYAPKPVQRQDPLAARPVSSALSDAALKAIARRVLEDLRKPNTIPSDVVLSALAEVRDRVEVLAKKDSPAR